jgi:hypothetical protein
MVEIKIMVEETTDGLKLTTKTDGDQPCSAREHLLATAVIKSVDRLANSITVAVSSLGGTTETMVNDPNHILQNENPSSRPRPLS